MVTGFSYPRVCPKCDSDVKYNVASGRAYCSNPECDWPPDYEPDYDDIREAREEARMFREDDW